MSYDIEIRSDDARSQAIAYEAAAALIRKLEKVRSNGRGFLYEDQGKKHHMAIEPQFLAEGEAKNLPLVNCVRLHIPYAFLHDNNDDLIYFDLAEEIAKGLGWFAYDAQMDEYTDGDTEKKLAGQAPVKKTAKKRTVKKQAAKTQTAKKRPVKKTAAPKTSAKKRAAKLPKPRRRK